jgi:molybdenum cofactor cytidylyltransferase
MSIATAEPLIRTLLLAAGSGRRFGADKLAAPLPDGTPLVLATARALLAAGADVLAVVRDGDAASGEGAIALLRGMPEVEIVRCPDAAGGMGHSLACAVRHSADADGWLVALADMPFIRPQTIRRLLDALAGGASLVAPCHDGRRGHPVGFARCWRESLLTLAGDTGARALLASNPAALTLVDSDDPGVLIDIDRREDLLPGVR